MKVIIGNDFGLEYNMVLLRYFYKNKMLSLKMQVNLRESILLIIFTLGSPSFARGNTFHTTFLFL